MRVSKSKLKAQLLEYLRRLEDTGEEIVITDHRVPVARIIPYDEKKSPAEVFTHQRGRVKYYEDVLEPTENEWSET